jgi:hypothetical protein
MDLKTEVEVEVKVWCDEIKHTSLQITAFN